VIVLPTGQTQLQTQGFTGPTYRQASEFLGKALGQTSSEQLTGEFYACSAVENSWRQRGT
jgi:hypothetical protein